MITSPEHRVGADGGRARRRTRWKPEIEVEEIVGAGERIFIAVRVSGRGRGSSLEIKAQIFHVLTEREGKLARIEWHATRASALKAAGLSK